MKKAVSEHPKSEEPQPVPPVCKFPEPDETEKEMQNRTFDRDDQFLRKDFALLLNRMIQNSGGLTENQSLSIAIDASWGMGKTQFLHMWQNLLKADEEKKQWKTVYYNAWKNDDYSDALAPLVCTIAEKYQEDKKGKAMLLAITEKLFKIGALGLAGIAGAAFPALALLAPLADSAISVAGEKKDKTLFQGYMDRENAKADFRQALKEMIGGNAKLIIAIDELDRCRPTFAIETLEVMKHFFNVSNVVFLFSLDLQQLSKSIATVYGHDMNACGYLARFFDCQLRLPTPTYKQLLSYIDLRNDLEEYVIDICTYFTLSIREIIMLKRLVRFFILSMPDFVDLAREPRYSHQYDDEKCFFFFLHALKLKDPGMYSNLLHATLPRDNYNIRNKIRDYLSFVNQYSTDAIQRVKSTMREIEEYNRKEKNNDHISNLISYFLGTLSQISEPDITFGQWLERRVEIFIDIQNDEMV